MIKKIMVAVIIAVMLLSLFVVGASASSIPPNHGEVDELFLEILPPQSNTVATRTLMDYYDNAVNKDFYFDVAMLVSGQLHFSGAYGGVTLDNTNTFTGGEYNFQIPIDYCVIYIPSYGNGYTLAGVCTITVDYFKNDAYSGGVSIRYDFPDSHWFGVHYNFEIIEDGRTKYTLNNVTVDNTNVAARYFTTADIAMAFDGHSSMAGIFSLTDLLFDFQAYNASTCFSSPVYFYAGIDRFHARGYEDGWRYGYDSGYDVGYELGKADAEEWFKGQEPYRVGYNDGYDKAVSEIDSGEYGRNMLGGLFSAPFDAIRNIVLVEWTTADGTTITINIMMILSAIIGLSLFIWFLKMFAGG